MKIQVFLLVNELKDGNHYRFSVSLTVKNEMTEADVYIALDKAIKKAFGNKLEAFGMTG